MEDLEAIRQRKLQELQAQQAQGMQPSQHEAAARQAEEQDAAVERMLQQILDDEARTRLTTIRMSRPDFHAGVVRQLVSMAQAGRLGKRLTDGDLKAILVQLTPKDRDISITRK
jgi:programmed cell death protein 5